MASKTAAVAKAPPYPKQKYTDAKFREIVATLPILEYLKVEYLSKGTWFKMISKRGNFYNCECCGVDNLGPTPIADHVKGKKHRFALQTTERLYHPNYTLPKTALARTADATNSANATKPTAAAAKAGKAAAQQPAKGATVAQAQKPSGQQKTTGPQQKATGPQQKATGSQQKGQPQQKPVVKKKPIETENPTTEKTNEAPKTNVVAPEIKVEEPVVSEKTEGKEITDSTANDNLKQSENTEKNENKESIEKKSEAKEQNKPEIPEIVILDDDEDDVPAPVQPVQQTNENKAVEVALVANSIETAKPQRPQKRAPNASVAQPKGSEQAKQPEVVTSGKENAKTITPTPPSKKVLNPAAILTKSAEKNSANESNTPRYQQNRIVIPTVDKTLKKPQQGEKQGPSAAAPSFSTKTFSTKSSNDVDGLIGVEYVVKILKVYNDPEPFYECCLCEVVMDGIGMQTHLLGYNHRYKYVEKHFPTCFNQYKEHIGNIQVIGIILDRIAKAIEAHHGRELPYECLSGEFRSNRHGVMTTVYSFRHASEYSGPSFTNVVDAKQVEDFYKQKNIYQPPKPDPKRKPTFDSRSGGPAAKKTRVERPPIGQGGGPRATMRGIPSGAGNARRQYREQEQAAPAVDDAVHKQMVEEFLQNTRGRSRSPAGRRRRHRSRSRSRSPMRRRPHYRSPSPLREGDIWQAYRHLVDRSKVELDQMYRDYRKDPEKHPQYNEEWRKFWKHRKEQMTREGLDHRNYDFQPEWVRFFAVRIEELYDESLEDIKINSRRRLILPMTNDELEDKRYHVKVPHDDMPREMPIQQQSMQYSQPSDNRNSVVSVLRLLTALEDYLGSLGPRVVDLLSKALLVEKSNPMNVNEIVLNLENCTILETAMEKLKGVLIAGLLEGPKVRAFNNVITETEKILRLAYEVRQRNPRPAPQPVPAPKAQQGFQNAKSSHMSNSYMPPHQGNSMGGGNIGTGGNSGGGGGGGVAGTSGNSGGATSILSQIDKKELATKLAAALTAQGKTDFNPEQLQQLIAVYSLIDKKKRDSAAVADKQKMTLSDTLTALLNPEKNSGGDGGMSGNYSNNNNDRNNDRQGSLSNSSISNFVSMLNRDNISSGGSGNSGDTQMWQNLQNIQTSLRMQNSMGTSSNSGGGLNNSTMGNGGRGGGGGGGGSGYMDNIPSGGNFIRGSYGGMQGNVERGSGSDFDLGQSSSLNFNRGGQSGAGGSFGNVGGGGGGGNGGFQSNFQSNNSNFSRGGGDNMLLASGRGGGQGGNSSYNSGGGGGGGGLGGNANFNSGGGSGGMGMGRSNFARGGGSGLGGSGNTGNGMGAGNNLGFSRSGVGSFLGGSGGGSSSGFNSNFSSSGLSNFNSSGGLSGGSNFQRNNGGMGGLGGDLGGSLGGSGGNRGLGLGGSNFNSSSLSSGFGNSMNSGSNFNPGRNDSGPSSFGQNQRNAGRNMHGGSGGGGGGSGNTSMGSCNNNNSQNQGPNRGGSNWRNQ